jgi:dolichyl-phosphate beta-glucosyltransferase
MISFILPVYNESNRLIACLDAIDIAIKGDLAKHKPDCWLVNDGSQDDTGELAQAYRSKYPWLHVLHQAHRGKGAAVQAGMLSASGDWRITLDCDLAMSLDQVPAFVAAAGHPPLFGFDVVCGSRMMADSQVRGPFRRRLAGAVFHELSQALVVGGLDTQCGFKLYSSCAASEVFSRLTVAGYAADVEALFVAQRLGYRITEVPIRWAHNSDSRVRLWRDSLIMLGDLLRIARNDLAGIYDRVPVVINV